MPNFFTPLAVICLFAMLIITATAHAQSGLFQQDKQSLRFQGDEWLVHADAARGYTSLQVNNGEYLHADDTRGGFAYLCDNRWFTRFPDRSNLAHDNNVGRIGIVADGRYMVKIAPSWTRSEFDLTFGANEKLDQQAFMFLHDDVLFVRAGANVIAQRVANTQLITRKTDRPVKARELLLVHKNGSAIGLRIVTTDKPDKTDKADKEPPVEFSAGMFTDPAGQKRLAVMLPTKGFAANTVNVVIDATPRGANFVLQPRFDVISSDDPAENIGGNAPTQGVKNPIYTDRTTLDYALTFSWLGQKNFTGTAELEVVHSLGQRHFYQQVKLDAAEPSVDPKDNRRSYRVAFQPKFSMPGVSEVWARLYDENKRLIWVDRYRMAYNWHEYKPNIEVQPDFQAFWADTLKQLREVPLEPESKRVFEDHPTFEIYHVQFNSWQKKRIHAMLYVPKDRAKPLPAVVTAHPGSRGFAVNKGPDGLYGSRPPGDPRFVTIQPLLRGHAPDAPDIPFNDPWWGPLEDRDTYVARAWYCAMVRAVDYLAERPDLVDIKRVVARGGSQGGALAIVTAALDPRIAYCIADCPSNAQPREIMFNYPSFGPSSGQVPAGKTADETLKMLSYYNPTNFAALIRCPTYVGSNIGDITVHSMGPLAIYHNLVQLKPDQKDFYPGFSHFHGSGPGLHKKANEIFELLGGPAPEKPKKK